MIVISREKVAALYMGLKIEEQDGRVVVSGPYPVIKDHIPKLKSMKFRYDGTTKAWWHPSSSKVTEKSVSEKLFGSEQEQSSKVEILAQEREQVEKLLLDFRDKKLDTFSVRLQSDGVLISGQTYPVRDFFGDAGAEWKAGVKGYFIAFENKSLAKVKKLVSKLEEVEEEYQKHKKEITKFIQDLDTPGASLTVNNKHLFIKFDIPVKFRLDSIFDFVRREDGVVFSVPIEKVSKKSLERFRDVLAEARQEVLHKEEEVVRKKVEDTRLGIKEFHRISRPYKVGEVFELRRDGTAWTVVEVQKSVWMDSEDAMSFGIMDMDRSGYVYYAAARPATDEEMEKAGILAVRRERLTAQEIDKARRKLMDLIKQKGDRPSGEHHLPKPFYTYNMRLAITGGGEWFVQDGNSVWYVQNNGSDGDDWSHNNVHTWGAGAIGWKTSVTPEMEPLISLLTEKGSDRS